MAPKLSAGIGTMTVTGTVGSATFTSTSDREAYWLTLTAESPTTGVVLAPLSTTATCSSGSGW